MRVYAVITHWRSVLEKARLCWADGRAMIMMVVSRITISWAPEMMTRTQRCKRLRPATPPFDALAATALMGGLLPDG